jgi:hypothetical protein
MIRQTSTGMEQRCPKCVRNGESPEDCWWPLTPEFFAVNGAFIKDSDPRYPSVAEEVRLKSESERA